MTEQEAIAYIEEWDVTEAAKVLKWYEEDELLRPCDCDTIVAIETEDLKDENAKLRELLLDVWNDAMQFDGFWDYVNDDGEIYNEDELPHYYDRMRKLGLEVR